MTRPPDPTVLDGVVVARDGEQVATVPVQLELDAPPCDCGIDNPGETHRCIDGRVYGPCDWYDCTGVCVVDHDCDCPCHDLPGGVS